MVQPEASILVVDDNEHNRYALVRRVNRLGYHSIREASNGREALDIVHSSELDLVLLDIMMPEVNGFEVLEQLHEEGVLAELPVIVISALDEIDSVVRCIELGAEDYLPKPFNAALLKARISAVLEKKRLRDEVAQQLAFIRNILGKYVPASIAGRLVAEGGSLPPVKTEATILYTDIEAFTSISESMSPEQVVQMLNEYFPAVIEPIRRHRGVVNQFQGDAMLVTFNVPVEDPRHADNALSAALEIVKVTQERTFAGVRLKTRIGINTGEVIAGNVGSGDRVSYTVHGDAVNTAARLEQMNKSEGTYLLVAGTTVDRLAGTYPIIGKGSFKMRGRNEPVELFTMTSEK